MHVFSVLADETRREIVEVLAGQEQSVGELTRRFQLTQPGMSRHLRVLRDKRLVRCRVEGRRRIYGIDARGFKELDDWLEPYRAFWSDRLGALTQFLDENPD